MNIRSSAAHAAVVTIILMAPLWGAAQTRKSPPQGAAKTANPSPERYSPPRTSDGQPDFQGLWGGGSLTIEPGYDGNLGTGYYQQFFPTGANITQSGAAAPPPPPDARECYPGCATPRVQTDMPDGTIPYVPAARAKKEANFKMIYNPSGAQRLEDTDPVSRCLPSGVPRASYIGVGGYQILQVPGYVVFLGEWNHLYRVIPLDKRPHIGANIRLWMGDARGRWEGNTLVVETTNSNGRTWLDHMGSIHSDNLRVTERYTMTTPNRISFELTLDDPKVFSRPWKLNGALDRTTEKNFELLEYACHEGNGRTLESLAPK